jgi:rare lipoprotein A
MKYLLALFLLILPTAGIAQELVEYGRASWYSSSDACRFNHTKGCPTESGKSLYALELNQPFFFASWKYRMGQKIKVTNVRNGKSVEVICVDRGPAKRLGRVIDLSRQAFQKISSLKKGVVEVSIIRV